jgi:flagellar biosynthesis/type III secretory pathway chaperone
VTTVTDADALAGRALTAQLESVQRRFAALKTLLDEEAGALAERALERIADITARKEALARDLEGDQRELAGLLAGRTVREFTRTVGHDAGNRLDALHESVRGLADACRHQNAVNGKIIHRSRQSCAELARILSGTDADPLYTAHGRARRAGDGHALASA